MQAYYCSLDRMLKAGTYIIYLEYLFFHVVFYEIVIKFTIVLPIAENCAMFFGNFSCGRQLDEFPSFHLLHVNGIQLTREVNHSTQC